MAHKNRANKGITRSYFSLLLIKGFDIRRLFSVILISVLLFPSAAHAGKLKFEELNFPLAVEAMKHKGKPLVLYISQTGCIICKRLERDVLSKVLKNDEYDKKITLQKILWDRTKPVAWIGSKQKLPNAIAQHYDLAATPTLLFLDHQGNEIAKRIVGYVNDDFYWDYLDKRIDKSRNIIAQGRSK